MTAEYIPVSLYEATIRNKTERERERETKHDCKRYHA